MRRIGAVLFASVLLSPLGLRADDPSRDFGSPNQTPSGGYYNNDDLQRRLNDLSRKTQQFNSDAFTPSPTVSVPPVLPEAAAPVPILPDPGLQPSPVYEPQLVLASPLPEPVAQSMGKESQMESKVEVIPQPTLVETMKTFFSNPEKPESAGVTLSRTPPAADLSRPVPSAIEAGPLKPAFAEVTMPQSASEKLFEGVAGIFKSVGIAAQTAVHEMEEGFVHLWDYWVLGRRTVDELTQKDGSFLEGEITLNRDGSIHSIAPGTTKTIAGGATDVSGTPSKTVQTVTAMDGKLWTTGTFVWDGNNFQLKGRGTVLVSGLEPYHEFIQSDTWLTEIAGTAVAGHLLQKAYNGDGLGHDTFLGYLAPEDGTQFGDKNSGFLLETRGKEWVFAPNQSGELQLQGQSIPIQLDDHDRLEHAVTVRLTIDGTERDVKITGILPNPDTGGYRLIGHVLLEDKDTLTLGIPGERPSAERSDVLMQREADAAWTVEKNPLNTQAQVHQSGDNYVFSQSDVAVALVTTPDKHGQQLVWADPILSNGTELTITGKTTFPEYGVTVYAGHVAFGAQGALSYKSGTLFSDTNGLQAAFKLNNALVIFKVTDFDPGKGTFDALMDHFYVGPHEGIKDLNLNGRIDARTHEAALKLTSYPSLTLYQGDQDHSMDGSIQHHVIAEVKEGRIDIVRIPDKDDSWMKVPEEEHKIALFAIPRQEEAITGAMNKGNTPLTRAENLSEAIAWTVPSLLEAPVRMAEDGMYQAKLMGHYAGMAYAEDGFGEKGEDALRAVTSGSLSFLNLQPMTSLTVPLAAEGYTFLRSFGTAIKSAVLAPLASEAGAIFPEEAGQFVHIDIGGEGKYPNAVNVNISETVTQVGQRISQGEPIPNLVKASAENMPFASRSVDLITVESSPLTPRIIDEISRIIKPGGEIQLYHPSDWQMRIPMRDMLAKATQGTIDETMDGDYIKTIIRVPQ